METPTGIWRPSARQAPPDNTEPDPTSVVPFGRDGVGLITGHPVGLVVVVGILLMGLVESPEARWFFVGALVLGGLWGFLLWLRHR